MSAPSKANRRNFYVRSPLIYAAFQAAVDKGIIKARSASERLETLLTQDVRRNVKGLRAAGIAIPKELLLK